MQEHRYHLAFAKVMKCGGRYTERHARCRTSTQMMIIFAVMRKGEPMNLNMKPDTALTILRQMLNKCRDTWEHDALVLAIEALKKEQNNGNNDSIFTR